MTCANSWSVTEILTPRNGTNRITFAITITTTGFKKAITWFYIHVKSGVVKICQVICRVASIVLTWLHFLINLPNMPLGDWRNCSDLIVIRSQMFVTLQSYDYNLGPRNWSYNATTPQSGCESRDSARKFKTIFVKTHQKQFAAFPLASSDFKQSQLSTFCCQQDVASPRSRFLQSCSQHTYEAASAGCFDVFGFNQWKQCAAFCRSVSCVCATKQVKRFKEAVMLTYVNF